MENNAKKSTLKIGWIVFGCFIVLNGILLNLGIGGLVREATRLGALVGIGMLVFGLFAKLFKEK